MMIPPDQYPRDRYFDPFTYLMFGSQVPPEQQFPSGQPPQAFYQNGGWQASGRPTMPGQSAPQMTPSHPVFIKPFLDQEGHVDVSKVVNSASQLANVIHQTAPAIKQLSPLFKFFQKP